MPGLAGAVLSALGWSLWAMWRHRATTCATFRALARTRAGFVLLAGFWLWLCVHLWRPVIAYHARTLTRGKR